MNRFRHPVLRALYSVFLGVTMLCVTAMPMLAMSHGLHELEHLLADAGDGSVDGDTDDGGGIDQLHSEDGCLHAQTMVSVTIRLILPVRRSATPPFLGSPPPASPSGRFLRPPIV